MGLVHDLGKMVALYGEPQYAAVGDTFPVGCALSDKCVFYEFFEHNPDYNNPAYKYVTRDKELKIDCRQPARHFSTHYIMTRDNE